MRLLCACQHFRYATALFRRALRSCILFNTFRAFASFLILKPIWVESTSPCLINSSMLSSLASMSSSLPLISSVSGNSSLTTSIIALSSISISAFTHIINPHDQINESPLYTYLSHTSSNKVQPIVTNCNTPSPTSYGCRFTWGRKKPAPLRGRARRSVTPGQKRENPRHGSRLATRGVVAIRQRSCPLLAHPLRIPKGFFLG